MNDNEIVKACGDVCGDNRFEIIEKYKQKLIEHTNIETAKDEMVVIDSILFRFWQMGWLERLEKFDRQRAEIERLQEIVNPKCQQCVSRTIESAKEEAVKEFGHFLIDEAEGGKIHTIDIPDYVQEFLGKGQ